MFRVLFLSALFTVALSSPVERRSGANSTEVGWVDPRIGGGRMVNWVTPRLGEPLNVVISGLSDPRILTHEGMKHYSRAIGFSDECLGLHMGTSQLADLGDGIGLRPEQLLFREHFRVPVAGTCFESLAGGNHFRGWKQNGTDANTSAWFLAVSKEKSASHDHKIIPDGYNIGRDLFVDAALQGGIWDGSWWMADVKWETGLLEAGYRNINHFIAQDGRVAVITVYRSGFVPTPRLFPWFWDAAVALLRFCLLLICEDCYH